MRFDGLKLGKSASARSGNDCMRVEATLGMISEVERKVK